MTKVLNMLKKPVGGAVSGDLQAWSYWEIRYVVGPAARISDSFSLRDRALIANSLFSA